jgi:hypothetical protein
MRLVYFLALSCLFLITACKKDKNNDSFQFHTDYFPIVEGQYIIYEATEMKHDDDALQHDTLRYWLKTKIGQIYFDNQGRVAREFLRYSSNDLGMTWQFEDVWTTILANNRLELVEENERIVKLVFAPTLAKEWDANVFNTKDKQNVSYSSIHESFSVNGNIFDSTVTVDQANFLSLVDLRRQNEVYAKGIGLVSKYYKDLTIEDFDTLNVKKGKELYYNCISFGIE